MKNVLFAITILLFISSCHRPTAYFQRTPHTAATRLATDAPTHSTSEQAVDSIAFAQRAIINADNLVAVNPVANRTPEPTLTSTTQLQRRLHRIQSLVAHSDHQTATKQPEPKPKKKLKLGNRIRQSLGMPLRKELNWWQRISWKLKASVIIVLVAVLFAIIHITLLAIIFGILGAFLLISGLKRSFKVRRPWF